MTIDAGDVRYVTLVLEGAAVVLPVIQPFVAILERLVEVAEEHGIIMTELPKAQAEAMASGMAAARASAVTSFQAHAKKP